MRDPIDRFGKILTPVRRRLATRAADGTRDAGHFADAAELYAVVLDMDPSRADIRVQRANMLKDAGRLDEAETEYRMALAQRPLDADIHLQLGHLHKVRGHRAEALGHYRCAAALEPLRGDADRELALAGDRDAQARTFRSAAAADGLLSLAAEIGQIRTQLEGSLRRLPDLLPQSAFPISAYGAWRDLWDIPAPPSGWEAKPVSVIVRIDDQPHAWLTQAASALAQQTQAEFQVLFAGSDAVRCRWAERIALADPRFEVTDIVDVGALLAAARYDATILTGSGTLFNRHALAWFGWALANTEAGAFICDDERGGPDERTGSPDLRQAVDHEILLQANPFGDTLALSRERCRDEIATAAGAGAATSLTLLLELSARGAVGHIPYPLVALAAGAPTERPSSDNHAAIVGAHLARRGFAERAEVTALELAPTGACRVRWRSDAAATLSVIVPTRNNGLDVQTFVNSLREHATGVHVSIAVIDNGTTDAESLRLLARLADQGVDVHRSDEPFNWSRLSNIGARRSAADVLLFANDDMQMLTPGWDQLLLGLMRRPDVGAVGAKLLYPDMSIQHAGVLFGWKDRTIHDGLYEPRYAPGPGGRWQLRRRVCAVTGAFFAIRSALFEELGGFDEQRLAISCSDLDLSLGVRRRGLAVLYAPEIELIHYESKSRGLTHLSEAAGAVDADELRTLRSRWPGGMERDPTVHPAWLDATLPFRLLAVPNRATSIDYLVASASPDPWRPVEPKARSVA